MSSREDAVLASEVPLVGRDEANRAVAMLAVVPADKASDPLARCFDVGEGQSRIGRTVLQRPEERLGVRVVVGDVRTAERRDDSKPLQRGDHRVAAHRLAVVGMEDEAVGVDFRFLADVSNHFGGELVALAFVDLPADDAAAVAQWTVVDRVT